MKQYAKYAPLFSLVALCNIFTVMAMVSTTPDMFSVSPFLQFRSQGRDTARKLYGTIPYQVYLDDMDDFYGTFNVTFQYDRSFRQNKIAQALFGNSLVTVPGNNNNPCSNNSNSEALVISGLNVPNRGAMDLMAENFLLPEDFRSTISFSPRVQDFLLDFNLYVGLDRWVNGMYFRLYGPFTANKCSLRAQENVTNAGTVAGSYPAGFFAPAAVANTALFSNAGMYFAGGQVATPIPGATFQPLQYAKFFVNNNNNNGSNNNNSNNGSNGQNSYSTGFAELRGEFGWNYIRENWHVGLNIQAAAPTGKRPHAERLFENQIGNGKHWELGGGFMAGYTFWNSEDGDRSFSFTFEADVTHLFKAKQTRTFDLQGKQLSRYMLAEQFNIGTSTNLFGVNPTTAAVTAANAQFNGTFAPVANFSTRDVKVSIGAQGDLVAMFTYAMRGFSWDLGYNFWGMSHEKIKLNDNGSSNQPFPVNWALKGDASVFGTTGLLGATPTGLSATENGANIHGGTNAALNQFVTGSLANPGVDNAQLAQATAAGVPLFVVSTFGSLIQEQINTSIQPIFIKETDLDVAGAQIRGYSNKVFTQFTYSWMDRERWVPYIGFGANGEFGSNRNNNNNSNSSNNNNVVVNNNNSSSSASSGNSGNRFALSKWAIDIKGGVSFH